MQHLSFNTLSRFADSISSLQKMPVYYSGDDTFVTTVDNASYDDYINTINEIKQIVNPNSMYNNTINANEFFWAQQKDGYAGAYYIPSAKQIRIVKRLHGELIPCSLTEDTSFGTSKKLIQLCPDDKASNFGMGYILCLGKGHFIIYDGNGDLGDMAGKIYRYLAENTPSGQLPIVDAWFVSHVHWDHVTALLDFSKKYADKVEVKNFLANFPALHNLYIKERGPNTDFYALWWPEILRCFPLARVWKIHTGQRFIIGDVIIEVLLTHEDVYPNTMYPNDSSTVTMMYVNGQKLFFSADIEYAAPCKMIHDMYGTYLKSDYYQVAHHGWNSEALYFYDDVDAPNILWPVRYRYWEMIQQFKATQRLTEELNSGKRNFFLTIDQDTIIEL